MTGPFAQGPRHPNLFYLELYACFFCLCKDAFFTSVNQRRDSRLLRRDGISFLPDRFFLLLQHTLFDILEVGYRLDLSEILSFRGVHHQVTLVEAQDVLDLGRFYPLMNRIVDHNDRGLIRTPPETGGPLRGLNILSSVVSPTLMPNTCLKASSTSFPPRT
jgi:hypothetical protein